MFHDGFRSHREYLGFLQPPDFENVVFDVHRYQCFDRPTSTSTSTATCTRRRYSGRTRPDDIQRELALPAIAGEWSLGLDLKVVSLWAEGPFDHALERMDALQEDVGLSRLRGGATPRLRALCRMVLLELPHGDDAGVVLSRVRGARLD